MTDRIPTLDPRVARTHQALRDALITLTMERGWDALNVQQVCARAGVGRSTFYVHFADNEDLLLSGFHRDHVAPPAARARNAFGFFRPLIEHVSEYRTLYQALVGTRCEPAVRRRFARVVSELVEAEVPRAAHHELQRTAAVRYLTGACTETLTWWLDQPKPQAAAEIERCLRQLSAGALAQLRPYESAPR